MSKIRTLFALFFSMFKIGAFTFGGGYAMIHLLENEFVARRGWLDGEEFLDLVTIAESTPGPIAINCSTYVGYKKMGVLGATVATLGMCIPSFTIIFIISLFLDKFLSVGWVAAAFCGIRACVVYLIFSAGLKMLRKIKKTAFDITVILITLVSMLTLSLLSVAFSTVFYILIFGALGLVIYTVGYLKDRGEGGK